MKIIIDIEDGYIKDIDNKHTREAMLEDTKLVLESASFIINSVEEHNPNANLRPTNTAPTPSSTS